MAGYLQVLGPTTGQPTGFTAEYEWLDYIALNKALESGRKDIARLLLNSNCRVNKSSDSLIPSNTPLHNAVILGDMDLVVDLLSRGAFIAVPNSEGNTPLHLAFLQRQEKIVDLMLAFVEQISYYVNPKNNFGLSHFHIACTRDNGGLVKNFVDSKVNIQESINADSPLWSSYTAMHFAVEHECLEVVKVLNAARYIYEKDSRGLSAWELAHQKSNKLAVIQHLASYENDDYEWNAVAHPSYFHFACMRDDPKALEEFIKHGANVNSSLGKEAVAWPAYTTLHFAVESNCEENVALLLKHGADVGRKNGYDMTPLHLAMYNEDHMPLKRTKIVDMLYAATKLKRVDQVDKNGLGYFHVAVTRNDLEMVKHYLDAGVDVNERVKHNLRKFSLFTPLHFAALYRRREMVELLIQRGADVNVFDEGEHGTPLHLAFEVGNIGSIELLLKGNADVKAVRPRDGKTMLHLLAENYVDHTETRGLCDFFAIGPMLSLFDKKETLLVYVKRLYELEVDVNAKDSEGNTALHIACQDFYNGAQCARRLINRGADVNLENKYGQTAFQLSMSATFRDNADDFAMMYHHVQRLKALGLKVNNKNEECCEELIEDRDDWDEDDEHFKDETLKMRERQRQLEIGKMKKVKLDEKTTVYQFVLIKPARQLSKFADNEALKKIVDDADWKKQYPSYGYLIRLQYKRAARSMEEKVAKKSEGDKVISVVKKRESGEGDKGAPAARKRRAK